MSTSSKSSSLPAPLFYLIGAVLMFGGYYLHTTHFFTFEESLAHNGIPLQPGKTIAVIGVLLILFQVIKFFFYVPLAEAIDSRNSELERTFTEAESLRTEMTTMKKDYEQRIVDTEAAARAQIQAQIKEAQDLRNSLMSEAQAKADDLVKRAQQDIETERNRVISDLRLHTVNLTLGATKKLIGDNLDSDRNRKLIEDFIEKAEVPV